ncbi:EAL domain-containing protein [Massilia sp. R2A-15]|uniref:EAL and HDOD domain-containing protein n=1 Tax=Massilia sp. R2A-15 TaxID=3064278 RepID=UPI002735177B|nr:EAL domain-containing protein [Massilia sp. R2A-15]WLI91676.1 EAL domain-containing protein [Massilia sp. R2A-15]
MSLPFDEFFLARQPILGRDQHLVAFELLFRTAGSTEANVTDDAAATAAVISHASQLGMEHVVGAQLAFVNVTEAALMSDYVRFLPADKVILEILETVKATPELVARVRELKSLGFKFALDDVVAESDDVRALVKLVDVIKIDVKGVDPARLPSLTASLRQQHKKLLAEKVETQEEFRLCLELGFEYFQGFYFARPDIMSGKKIAPSELAILDLLELVNSDADNHTIELAVKRDALISLNLLRLVNTPAAGVRGKIDTLGQAIEVLGRRQLQRWLQILLYATPGAQVEMNLPLLQMATTRGKMLELMSLKIHPGQRAAADTGFTVGIMSLTDALFSMSMEDILDTVDVAGEARAALLDREGEYGEMLNIVEMLEKDKCGKALSAALRHLDLTIKDLREIELAAFEWINELAQEVH